MDHHSGNELWRKFAKNSRKTPEVEKALVNAGENILTTLENFINNVAEGSGRFFESAFKEEEKKSKS